MLYSITNTVTCYNSVVNNKLLIAIRRENDFRMEKEFISDEGRTKHRTKSEQSKNNELILRVSIELPVQITKA